MEKTCKACGLSKPTTEFHKDRQKKDGFNHYCKPCHIARQRTYDLMPPRFKTPEGTKRCSRCKTIHPLDNFHLSTREYDGHERMCKDCRRDEHRRWAHKYPEKAAALQKKWRDTNPRRSKDHKLKQTYGIPIGTYEKMLEAQNGGCAICGTTSAGGAGDFHVDHCHNTKIVRGLLCHACNVSIGHFKHDVKILESAINYLKHFHQVNVEE